MFGDAFYGDKPAAGALISAPTGQWLLDRVRSK
jgi:hypothetical protein